VSETEPSYDEWPDLARRLKRAIRAKKTDDGREHHVAAAYNACCVCRLLWAITYLGPATIVIGEPSDPVDRVPDCRSPTDSRYRKALEEIANHVYHGTKLSGYYELQRVARGALSREESQQGGEM